MWSKFPKGKRGYTDMKIAIIGAGKLGRKVADALLGGDHSLTVVDSNEHVLE